MARGIIGKLVRGAAQAGVPMLQEEHRAQIQARRDEALNRVQQQYRKEDQSFQKDMNAQNQQFEAGQRNLDRTARADEFSATRADAADARSIQREGLQMDREKLDLTAQQIAQTLQAGELGIIEQKRLQGLYDTIASPEAQPDEITRAITVLNGLKGQNPEKYSAITLYSDELDDMGNQLRTSGILNQSTGEITPAAPRSGSASTTTPQTQAEYDALPSGALFIDPDDGLTYRKP